jgi:hypothetical protein
MSKRVAAFVIIAGLMAAAPLRAVSFKATMSSIKLDARPGQVLTSAFRITVDEGQPATRFKVRMEDWWRSEDGKQSFYAEPGKLSRSCGQWVTTNPVEAVAQPGEPLTIRLTVAVPRDAAPGGFWCVLTLDEVPDPRQVMDGVGMKFLASTSSGIFIYLSPLERQASITDLRIQDAAAVVTLRNGGNTPLGIEGRFEFVKPGESVPTATVKLARGSLLTEPVVTGQFAAPLPDAATLPSGHYVIRAIIDYGVDHYIGAQREVDLQRAPPTP